MADVTGPGGGGIARKYHDNGDGSYAEIVYIGGGGGGGAATVADGADVTQGATTDGAVTANAAGTVNAHLRGIVAILADLWDSVGHRLRVDGSGVTQPVSGTVTANAGSGTLAVSNASLPLPTGAATAAKQPALGTAGSASVDVITVQGIAAGTAQPVSIASAVGTIAKDEDAPHSSGDTGVPVWAVRNDTIGTTLTSLTGDYSPLAVDGQGRLGIRGSSSEDGTSASGDIGLFILGVRRDADGVQTSTDGDYGEFSLDSRNNLRTTIVRRAGTGALTNVPNATGTGTILAANTARRGFKIFNDDMPVTGASLSVKYGVTASATSRTKVIAPGECWEPDDGYTGIIDGIASAATGTARVTELT